MPKMKHLLRKLHIGGAAINEHQILPVSNPNSVVPSPSSSSAAVLSSTESVAAAAELVAGDREAGNRRNCDDFSFMEEEFQMQLAMAISASDQNSIEDPDSAQIDAAKRISLGCSQVTPVTTADPLLESLSIRYWSYNVVNYNEKVNDGFYDIYRMTSNSVFQETMPSLVDLQVMSVSDNVDYEVILVNRFIDPELRELEKRADSMYLESRSFNGLVLNSLIQRLADIVVNKMGGPVGDADEISTRWTRRNYELRNALNTIVIPLGRLDVGLSRHRALLFKVLADKINLPCMLVKGSYYTGTDHGAVNLIKNDDGSEYIIDLMGAPGTLIPAEVPSCYLPNFGLGIRGFAGFTESTKGSSLSQGEENVSQAVSSNLDRPSKVSSRRPGEGSFSGIKTNEVDINPVEKNLTENFEHEFGNLLPSFQKLYDSSSTIGNPSAAQTIKVKNVSKYVISAAKNPGFAQKLHAVLLESGASPPPDLFSDINPQDLAAQKVPGHLTNALNLEDVLHSHSDKFLAKQNVLCITRENSLNNIGSGYEHAQSAEGREEQQKDLKTTFMSPMFSPGSSSSYGFVFVDSGTDEKSQIGSTGLNTVQFNPHDLAPALDSCQLQNEHVPMSDDKQSLQGKMGGISNLEMEKESDKESIETASSDPRLTGNGNSERADPMLGEVAEWEIPWEDLQIGERVGIGSYGEVYHADWNGTEVAVKKFLDQDFSGDALVQFRYEAELMLRLRHPNIVLFMGAVTRPPHLSILTEYLPRGSLYKLLHRSNTQLEEKRRMRMAIDVAKGMNYLHTSHPTIVHRDLKTPNLLVDKNWVVKVCDFGMSRLKHHTFLSSKSTAGTPEWMAPEVLRNEPANEKCDVYSFGVILWELATCKVPWKGMNSMQVVGAVGFQNKRLDIPPHTDPDVAQIIYDCWQTDPYSRPSFSQIISRLRHVHRLLVEKKYHSNQATEQPPLTEQLQQ